jgi:hypothetical protein
LKAFLRAKDHSLPDLRKLGHNLARLAEAAKIDGLGFSALSAETLSHVTDADVAIEARYIVTGFKTVPTIEAFAGVAQELDSSVGDALVRAGATIHERSFEKPRRNVDQDEQTKIEEDLGELTEQERKILAYLLHHNQRMFECALDGGNARLLISRGIVRSALRPGQVFDAENVPMEVPRPIWSLLKKHRSMFPYEPAEDDGHPWRVHWMLR